MVDVATAWPEFTVAEYSLRSHEIGRMLAQADMSVNQILSKPKGLNYLAACHQKMLKIDMS
ncbi:MAG: hypothetical protein BZY75_02890 [SAR202 cluster bacterium Io17-Chloro-G7]|nr:MAG: hypothetical protein BZY75_02890 [SAR202 cluster bacterium Io17-Chloro-G7]